MSDAPTSTLVVQNPIEELRLAALEVFPDLRANVAFVGSTGPSGAVGETFFPDDGSTPTVQVYVYAPLPNVIEVMAHELAHVAVGVEAGHGPAWQGAYDSIQAAWTRRMDASDPLP